MGDAVTILAPARLPLHRVKAAPEDPGEADDDLLRDMIEVLTWMCARLYSRRGPGTGRCVR
jgi:putative resolvase